MHRSRGRTVVIAVFVVGLFFISAHWTQAGSTAAATRQPEFPTNLQRYDTGPEVLVLQKILNVLGFPIAQTGPGSPGNETNFFGLRTYRALVRYQQAHVLPATGYFGPLTRAAINAASSTVPSNSSRTSSEPSQQSGQSAATSSQPLIPLSLPALPPLTFGGGGEGGGGGDTTPPVIGGTPSNITAEATSASGATVTYATPSATDNLDGTDAVSCSPASGSTFALGVTTVTCIATDRAGNSSHSSFSVTVQDTTAPTVSMTVPSGGATVGGSSVTLTASASDNVTVGSVRFKADSSNIGSAITSSPYTTTWNSTGVSDGSHTLYAVAEDTAGNYATSSEGITVRNSPPVISSIASSTASTTATITWTTDEAATSEVNYGTTNGYGSASSSATLVTSHSVTLTGLSPNLTYHFQAESVDALGHTATSSDRMLMTFYDLPKWDAAKTTVSGGTGNAKLVFYGESTTAGAYASGPSTIWNNALALSYPADLQASLPNSAFPGFTGTNGVTDSGTAQSVYDPRFTATTGWSYLSSGITLGESFLNNDANTNPLSWEPSTAFDTIDLYYSQQSGLGTFTVDVDGGSPIATINCDNATQAYAHTTLSVPLGTHTIDIVRTSNGTSGFGVFIDSISVSNSATKQISTYVAGWSGGTAANLSDTSNAYSSLNALKTLAPDLTVIMIGNNDWDASTSISTFSTNLQSIITAAKQSGDVVLVSDAPSAASAAPIAQQQEYINTMSTLAASNNINFVNLTQLWGSYTQANSNGWMANTVHPNGAGYAQIAAAVLPYLLR